MWTTHVKCLIGGYWWALAGANSGQYECVSVQTSAYSQYMCVQRSVGSGACDHKMNSITALSGKLHLISNYTIHTQQVYFLLDLIIESKEAVEVNRWRLH